MAWCCSASCVLRKAEKCSYGDEEGCGDGRRARQGDFWTWCGREEGACVLEGRREGGGKEGDKLGWAIVGDLLNG